MTLVGTWSLVTYEAHDADARVHHPLGRDAAGVLIYGADGYMSVQIMGSDGSLAYAGRYELDEHTVIHHVQVSLEPRWVGRPLRRSVELDGDRLTLTADGETSHRLTWQRV